MAKPRSRVYHRAKGQVRRDALLHSRSRWLYYRSWSKQAGLHLRLNGTTHESIRGDRVRSGDVKSRRTDLGVTRTGNTEMVMKTPTVLAAAAALIVGGAGQAASLESTSATTTYHSVTVDGVGVFYREAGPKEAPTLVLLHGFPSSSREFDTLIPVLATHYHLIAPDFPGFGQSDAPPPSSYAYTFDNLAKTINGLLEQLEINKYSLYLHDYGGPVGFRIISAHPERLQALIIQNANAYREGLGAKWAGIAQYWTDPKSHPEVFDAFVSFKATEQRHTLGTSHPERYNPD